MSLAGPPPRRAEGTARRERATISPLQERGLQPTGPNLAGQRATGPKPQCQHTAPPWPNHKESPTYPTLFWKAPIWLVSLLVVGGGFLSKTVWNLSCRGFVLSLAHGAVWNLARVCAQPSSWGSLEPRQGLCSAELMGQFGTLPGFA
jgi:hypothetical protein